MCIWQIGIIEECSIRFRIQCDARLSRSCDVANDTGLTNLQLMTALQHDLSAFTIRSAKNSIFLCCIKQENAHMIKTKFTTDHCGNLGEQDINVPRGTDRARY